MMVAILNNQRVEASSDSKRGEDYRCPACSHPVGLKAGRVVIPHFAHKAEAVCAHYEGETRWHRQAKSTIADYLRRQGHAVEIEFRIGPRIADVFMPETRRVYEVQISPMDLDGLYQRSADYARHGCKTCWVLPLKRKAGEHKTQTIPIHSSPIIRALYSEKKAPRQTEVAFFEEDFLLFGSLKPHRIWKTFYEDGETSDYEATARRWVNLVVDRRIDLQPPVFEVTE